MYALETGKEEEEQGLESGYPIEASTPCYMYLSLFWG